MIVWIKLFLAIVAKQCEEYTSIVSEINGMYDEYLSIACEFTKTSNVLPIINRLYRYLITTAKQIVEETGLPLTSVNRVLNKMNDAKILITDGKQRNKKYIYYGLLDLIR